MLSCGDTPAEALPEERGEVTWYRDVLPIAQRSCQGCHTAGGIGRFSLESYATASSLHLSIADAVRERRMPPWMPNPSCNSYQDERRLSQEEIDTIVRWSEAGAPEGDPTEAPSPPEPATLEWVDTTLDPGVDYTPSSAATDDYHCFILDPALGQTTDVIGFDIVPGVRRMVHHVLLYSADRTVAQSKDAQSPDLAGWTCFGGPGTSNPQVVGGWVPGTPVTEYPKGTGIRLQPNQVLVMQIHYNTSAGGAEPDRTKVKLQYAPSPVAKVAHIVPVAEAGFAIPPNSTNHETSTTQTGLLPLTVHGVLPHMHTLGRRIRTQLGDGTCLVDIPKWDFHWQQFYFFERPIASALDNSVTLTCAWDNPTSRTVTWGEGTSDEMCLAYYYITL